MGTDFCTCSDDKQFDKTFDQQFDKQLLINKQEISEIEGETKDDWTEQSLEWYKIERMEKLSQFIINKHCQLSLNENENLIWNKFDVKKKNRLRTKKYLAQLLYSYIWLILKSEKVSPPKFKQLNDVLEFYSDLIIQILPNEQKIFIDKYHYNEYIALYIEKITNQRKIGNISIK